jgi:hypothetical protein
VKVFCRVFGEAHGRFDFELRGFRLGKEWLSFYIRPEDGMQLPAIMQWVKQTFAERFTRDTDRTGHVWGDRYWSKVLEGEPPGQDWEAVEAAAKTGVISFEACPSDGVSPLMGETPAETGLSSQNPGGGGGAGAGVGGLPGGGRGGGRGFGTKVPFPPGFPPLGG